jgi:LPXTG-motif cell wall-anchored protein
MRLAILAAALVVVFALQAGTVAADGDPASDVLLFQNTFLPYNPPMDKALAAQLDQATAAAKKAHYPIRVAVIGSTLDLGAITGLWKQPKRYARFLYAELYGYRGGLLVVMPNGVGTAGLPPARARRALAGLSIGPGINGLGRAALDGTRRLAAAGGHPLPTTTPTPPSSSGGPAHTGSSTVVVALVVAAILALALGAGYLLARRRLRT